MVDLALPTKGMDRLRLRAALASSSAADLLAPEPMPAAAVTAKRTGGGSGGATFKPRLEGRPSAPEREAASARWSTRLDMATKEAGRVQDPTACLPEAELPRQRRQQVPLPFPLTFRCTLRFVACTTVSTRQRRKAALMKLYETPSENIATLPFSSLQVTALPRIKRAHTSK